MYYDNQSSGYGILSKMCGMLTLLVLSGKSIRDPRQKNRTRSLEKTDVRRGTICPLQASCCVFIPAAPGGFWCLATVYPIIVLNSKNQAAYLKVKLVGMKVFLLLFCFWVISSPSIGQTKSRPLLIDETNTQESIVQTLLIDEVWAGHPVGFCLLTQGDRQYIAYYNAQRNMVVGQRNLNEPKFDLHVLPATSR
jgi:hypothetical protein